MSGIKRRESPVVRAESDTGLSENKSVGRATVSYTARLNRTSVFFALPVIYQRQPLDTFELQVAFDVVGRRLIKPETVIFGLEAQEKRAVFKTARSFKLKADGREYSLSKVSKKSEVYAGEPEQLISGEMQFAEFEQIANSSKIAVQVGPFTFPLDDIHLEAMRDMIRAITAP